MFCDVGLCADDCDEEDAGAGEETGGCERLEDGVVASGYGVGVEVELCCWVCGALFPEVRSIGVSWELEEYFGVSAHLHSFYTSLFPCW